MSACVRRSRFLRNNFAFIVSVRTLSRRGPLLCTPGGSTGEQSNWEEPPSRDSEEDYEYEIKKRILNASLRYVHDHGWTITTLSKGAESEGYPSIAHGMFPRGGAELVHHLYATWNAQLAATLRQEVVASQQLESERTRQQDGAERLQEEPADGDRKKSTTEFISNAVETRLRMIIPYMDKWPQAMAILALPQNAPEAMKNLLNLTDDIWYYAGDRSADFNWYTKRLALAGVYKSTELCMIQDKSVDYTDTWDFLDRRLEDLKQAGKLARKVTEGGQVAGESFWGLTQLACNLAGMNSYKR
ncbi:ubiquinone biosynthesis protein COQ9, mitochondrial isoform X4 [Lingula anatina]|uniref:Ubiquinone biosynthesis protein n=1 Tax=Lingula anatina TaxID=7574 RepID=A0A1S3H2Y8_LINAN|nr:ubiquinone biosynthesis protein COQ9, mitochondrial isoform X3 [Lingula anatina]XP_013380312.1 ubiquinone biosynthesis protein COQ9, mitochondrial isoform X4 [Lingula anatina]|eukprot:XP_013380311.1 ubiquinone biosynthesis protein COQ9, mitochondrial isoform X3 [Lingula anatina]